MAFTEEQQKEIIKLIRQNKSNRSIAREYLGRDSLESSIRRFKKKLEDITEEFEEEHGYKPRILIGDVECSCNISYHFGRRKVFIKPEQVEKEPYLLSFAGKWLDNPAIISYKLSDYPTFDSDYSNDELLTRDLHSLLDKCDIFIAHNANFDNGWMNQRFVVHGLTPPSPFKLIDTLKTLRKQFSLPSNTLKAACQYFGLEHQKLDNSGIELWIRCMNGDREAFNEMETYNIGDILALEGLYLKIRPWIYNHPNVGLLFKDTTPTPRCVKCGSEHLIYNTEHSAYTSLSEFNILTCCNCGSHNRTRNNLRNKELMKETLSQII